MVKLINSIVDTTLDFSFENYEIRWTDHNKPTLLSSSTVLEIQGPITLMR